jgi:hypothetical protein
MMHQSIRVFSGDTGNFECVVKIWFEKKPFWDVRQRFDHAETPASYGNYALTRNYPIWCGIREAEGLKSQLVR